MADWFARFTYLSCGIPQRQLNLLPINLDVGYVVLEYSRDVDLMHIASAAMSTPRRKPHLWEHALREDDETVFVEDKLVRVGAAGNSQTCLAACTVTWRADQRKPTLSRLISGSSEVPSRANVRRRC